MRTILLYLPAVACLAMMAVICIPMMRNMGKRHEHHSGPTDVSEEVPALREEVARLKTERAIEAESAAGAARGG